MKHEADDDPLAARAAEVLRAPVTLDPGLRARIDDAVRAEPLPRRRRGLGWLVERRLVLSPLTAGLIAAGLVGVGVLVARRDGRVAAIEQGELRERPAPAAVVRFVLVAPNATHVSLVGDFNDWNVAATPMQSAHSGAIWTVALPLPAGRHVYAFVVDGREWVADPAAPRAPEDGFGTPNSVVVVGEAAS
jgi:hypothetical protein